MRLIEAISSMLQLEQRFDPQADLVNAYQTRYDLYRALYPAIKEISHRL